MVLVGAVAALLALWPHAGFGLDVALGGERGGHALLRLGVATIRIAFDSGHYCPDSNACTGAIR